MSKAKVDLQKKGDLQIKKFSANHIEQMAGNPNFTTPEPPVTEYQAMHDAYDVALDDVAAAAKIHQAKIAIKDAARAVLEGGLTDRCAYVNLKAKDKAKQLSSGLDVTGVRTPATLLPAVQNLCANPGDNAGSVNYHWFPLTGAKTIQLETSPDPMTPTSWVRQKSTTKSKSTVPNLLSGSRQWGRVRGVNSAGEGAWSDPVAITVP